MNVHKRRVAEREIVEGLLDIHTGRVAERDFWSECWIYTEGDCL